MNILATNSTLQPAKMKSEDFFRALLPEYGEKLDPIFKGPRWLPGHKGWIVNEYLNESGNYYFWYARFSKNLLVLERDCIWGKGNLTYLDDLAIWQFDGENRHLIAARKYDKVIREESFVRAELEDMLKDHIYSQAKLYGNEINEADVNKFCHECVEECFKDFLDNDYEIKLNAVLPMLECNINI